MNRKSKTTRFLSSSRDQQLKLGRKLIFLPRRSNSERINLYSLVKTPGLMAPSRCPLSLQEENR
ncbi:hypothetical protein LMG9964_02288 [Paraburkholderia phenoliruptrix]|uniref:Uncharacterized protein n=1 Tax=Paraburkholderia phenoliruptrix TaxID=252970 RepID=A0A6J5K4N0_9BURK|nr:hypothetical protein LMG9964_02288 [Paraburkholderia phenoliruptrix]